MKPNSSNTPKKTVITKQVSVKTRRNWGINPVTRVVESKRAYKRNKFKDPKNW